MKRYIRCNSEIKLKGNSLSYFNNIKKILNDKNVVLSNIQKMENSEIDSIMNNPEERHNLIRSLALDVGYKLQPGNNVVCYVYAAICFIIFKYKLHQDPIIVLGSLDSNLTKTLNIMHVWCECDDKIYDYPKANPSFEYTPILYFDGISLESAMDAKSEDKIIDSEEDAA